MGQPRRTCGAGGMRDERGLSGGSDPAGVFEGFDPLSDVADHAGSACAQAKAGQPRSAGDPVNARPGTPPEGGQLLGGDVRRFGLGRGQACSPGAPLMAQDDLAAHEVDKWPKGGRCLR